MRNNSIFVDKYKIVNKLSTNKFLNKLPLSIKKIILSYTYTRKVKKDFIGQDYFIQSMLDLYDIINTMPNRQFSLITKDFPPISISIRGNCTMSICSDTRFSIQLVWYGETAINYDYFDSNNNRYSGRYDNTKGKDSIIEFYEIAVYDTLEYVFHSLFKEYFIQIRA